jgi:hypothetical protein
MAHPTAPINTFNIDWAKVKTWAQQQKIPTNAVNDVYTLDQARIAQGGYGMSNSERTRAIEAAAGLNYSSALPTDSPRASNVIGNTVSNVQQIGVGLMPTRLASNIWDTLKNTVEDIADPARLKGATPEQTLANLLSNTVASWVPGAADVGTFLKADAKGYKAGLDALATQPVSTFLDVMPALHGLSMGVGEVAARSAIGDALSERLGMSTEALGRMGAVRMAGKGVGSIKVGSKDDVFLDAEGNSVTRTPTLQERLSKAVLSHGGFGKQISDAAHALMSTGTKYTNHYRKITSDLTGKVAKLTPDVTDKAGNVLQKGTLSVFNEVMHSGREASDIMNDDKIPLDVREAVKAYEPWEQWHREYMLESGKLTPLKLPDGTTAYYESTSHLFGLRKSTDDALAKAAKASEKADGINEQALKLDGAYTPLITRITEIKDAIAGTVNMQPEVSKTYLNMFGRLTGRDGLLETMQKAVNEKDWVTLRDAAKKADKAMSNKTVQGWRQVPMLNELSNLVHVTFEYAKQRAKMDKDFEDAYSGRYAKSKSRSAEALNKKAQQATDKFMAAVRKNPPAEYRDVVLSKFFDNFLASDKAETYMDESAKYLKEHGYNQEVIDRIRSDPRKLYELVVAVSDPTFRDPFIPNMTPGDHAQFMNSALKEVDDLRARGYKPMYVPTVSGAAAGAAYLRDDRIYVNPTKYPTISSGFKKAMDMSSTVNDVMLGVSRATKEALGKDATLEFVDQILRPMLHTGTSLRQALVKANLHRVAGDTSGTALAVTDDLIHNQYGLSKFNVSELLGMGQEEVGLHPDETYYISTDVLNQVNKLVSRDQFPLHGAWDKATGVFKFSILGLSPRYTAHILFGGTMLLALRVGPDAFTMIGKAAKAVHAYHNGLDESAIPEEVFQGAAQKGSPDVQVHWRGGKQMGYMNLQEKLISWGINPKLATAVQWARAAADVNFRFTNYISDMQRAIAYLDGAKHAERAGKFTDPLTGEVVPMTADRAHFEGMRAAERVMGNLQAMTPFERSIARKIMPFYGWTKHILKYVLTYPVDHPWRTMFLSTLATQNTDRFASGLDDRMQLLFFLGQPDASGNVSAVDIRELDPFRDVANYATIGGWLSSLNPVLTAPAVAIDPSIIYGNNVLYPNVTYNSVYGTNQAAASGTAIGAIEQEVPELKALDDALGLSSSARALKKSGGTNKDILNSLNIPMTEVQHLNLKQIAAKHEIDRYNQAKTEALNAWQTGDFSTLLQYPGTVPDPLQTGYNITPKELEKQYQEALAKYHGLPPSETVAPLPAPRL